MFKIIISIDYEIHGNGDGCPMKLMVEPTYRMMKLFDSYNAKLTIMADVAEILKFKEYKDSFGEDKYHYKEILKQLRYAVTNGHDVQLHIHSGYFNSEFNSNGIRQNWDEYDLANLPYEIIYSRIYKCKSFLETELQKVNPNYKCIAFRAANWSMVPAKNISNALIENGITIDSSVFKWGKRIGRVNFDYSNAPDKLVPWFISENNICEKDSNGKLLEIPIYAEYRNFLAFITPIRAFRMIRARFHKHELPSSQDYNAINTETVGDETKKTMRNGMQRILKPFIKKHSWKLDINQSTSFQLIKATKRIWQEYNFSGFNLPIILIGHSKSFIKYNEKSIKKYLKYVSKNNEKYQYALFDEIEINNYK